MLRYFFILELPLFVSTTSIYFALVYSVYFTSAAAMSWVESSAVREFSGKIKTTGNQSLPAEKNICTRRATIINLKRS